MTMHAAQCAVAYYRTSSAAGVDGDSEERRRQAVKAYAKSARLKIVGEFYDAAVSGADTLDMRPGFSELMASLVSSGANKIIVETANRFARDLLVQEQDGDGSNGEASNSSPPIRLAHSSTKRRPRC